MPNFSLLAPLANNLHHEFVRIYYLMLPVFFSLAVVIQWFKSGRGTVEFIDILRRAIISTVLLVAFPDISWAIIAVADGIAERVDSMNNLDAIIRMAGEKSSGYTISATSMLLAFDDLLMSILTFLSFIVLYIARYLNIAMYHFFWIFFMICAPLLLLFNIFQSTAQITTNLFRGMIEVACWKIVWAILGAMLASLSFGKMYLVEGSYVTLVVMNFVIALAMLATPLVVKSLVGSGFQSISSTIGPAAASAMSAVPARSVMTLKMAKMSKTLLKDSFRPPRRHKRSTKH